MFVEVEFGLKSKKVFNCAVSLLSVTIALGTSIFIVDNIRSFNTDINYSCFSEDTHTSHLFLKNGWDRAAIIASLDSEDYVKISIKSTF